MTDKMKKFEDIKKERKKLEVTADDQLKHLKSSFVSAKQESKSVLVNRILIPAGIALVAGYGVKKLIDYMQSDNGEEYDHADSKPKHQASVHHSSTKNGLLTGINWSGMAMQLVPFVIKVGQRLYEDGNLPWFKPPGYEEAPEE